jgi:hypothetical protein
MRSALTTLILVAPEAEERAMDDVELRRQLERAHADCFGWATDVLLQTPGSELLSAMPALGTSILDEMIPVPSNRGT